MKLTLLNLLTVLVAWQVSIGMVCATEGSATENRADKDGARSKLAVAVTIPPQAWLVDQIGGERLDVMTLIGPGEDPHSFMPSDSTVAKLSRCRLFFRIGVPAENGRWFKAISSMGSTEIVHTRDGIQLRHIEGHDHAHGHDHEHGHGCSGDDPHVWLSPELLRIQAGTMADALVKADPANTDFYRGRHKKLDEDLAVLHGKLAKMLAPCKGRSMLVFHPSWGYLTDAFGIKQVAIEQGGKEPSDHELAALHKQVRAEGISTLFIQPQIAGKSANTLADALKLKLVRIDPLARDVPANLLVVAAELLKSLDLHVNAADSATEKP